MALTRKFLTALGIEGEKIDQIIEGHSEAVEALKAQRDEAEAKAEELRGTASRVPSLEKQIEELEAARPTEDWEAKYNEKSRELDAFKAEVAEERERAEKASLYKAALREAGVAEKFIDDIMGVTDLSAVAVEDGKLADADALQERFADKYATFISKESVKGAEVATPPSAEHTQGSNPEIVKRLQERHERMYGAEPTQTKE